MRSSTAAGLAVPLHGVGGARDLPIPAGLAIAAGTAALVLSFVVLLLAWRTPRYDVRTAGRPVPPGLARAIDSPATRVGLRVFGLAVAGYLVWPLLWGPDVVTNPVIGFFYVPLWVGIVPFSLAFGPAFRLVSPVRTLHLLLARATGRDPTAGRPYPSWLGYWPASIGLFAFVWQELVNPSSTYLGSIRVWLGLYLATMLLGSAVYGEVWLRRADPFEVYSELVGRLAVIGRRPATAADARGALVVRSPLAGLDGTPALPGLVAVLAVLFGSTAFDSYKDQLRWITFVESQPLPEPLIDSAALLVAVVVVGVTFSAAALATGAGSSVRGPAYPRHRLPALLAHSLVPIVVGYMTAHYLSYFVEQGQVVLIQLSDPMVDGADVLGTANWRASYWLSLHPSLLATVKVLAIVLGHVTGAVAAHDRALRLLPRGDRMTGQLAMLVLMVAYTATGLYLLFGA